MALRKTITLTGRNIVATAAGTIDVGEISVNMDAYIKVEAVDATKQSATATVTYKDGAKYLTKQFVFAPSLEESNFIKQAYEHLKTLPEFAGAIDC